MFKLLVLFAIIFVVHSLSYTGVLKVGEEGSGKNPMFFSVSGHCTVNSGSATLDFKINSGWAKLNGKKYRAGNTGSISVSAGQTFSGEAGGHVDAWGKNMGPDAINFTCSGSLGEAFELMEQGIEITELITETITVPVGKSASYKNPMFFGVSATCSAQTSATSTIAVTDNSGDMRVNNQDLTSGQSSTVSISNGESLNLYVSGHADATIDNQGPAAVTLTCSVALAADYLNYKLAQVEW